MNRKAWTCCDPRFLGLALVVAGILVASALPARGFERGTIPAAATRAPDGHWQGTLQGMLRIVVHVQRSPAGVLSGTLDSPDQGAVGLPLDSLVFAADTLRFEMRLVGGGFSGRMSAAGDSIVGQWRQAGISLPLALVRTDTPARPRRPQEVWPPYPYDTVAVRFDNPRAPGVTLAGTLTLPRGQGPFPCALLITGSGPEDRDETVFGHRPFRVLADHLTRHGIAVLRLDDRGVGGSTGTHATATSDDFGSDVRAGVDFLRARREIDRRRIGLIGHSEGGLIAPRVAVGSKDVAFIVLMAGPGIPGDSTLALQSAALRRSIGATEASIAHERVVTRRLHAALVRGDSLEIAAATHELVDLQLAGLSEEQRRALGDLDSIATRAIRQMTSPWMRFFVGYDPRPTLRQVACPVLAINGEKDLQVLPNENLAAIRTALEAGGNPAVTVKVLPGLNHLFQTCATCTIAEYAQLEETLAPTALDAITSWVIERTRKR